MRKGSKTWLAVVGLAGALSLAGCAGGKAGKGANIEEEWLARVPQSQMGPVEDARAEHREAQDALLRAEVAVKDAENNKKVAEERLALAKQQREVEQARLESAKNQGQAPAIEAAERAVQQAQLQEKVAENRVELRNKQVDVANAVKDLQSSYVQLEEADLKRAQYNALAGQNDTRIQQVDPSEIEKQRTEAQASIREKEKKVSNVRTEASNAESKLRNAEQQLQAAAGNAPRG